MAKIENQIREKLVEEFKPSHIELENESYKHSVPKGSESHFRLVLVSERFEGQNRVARQRAVNQVIAEELSGPVHAFSQRLFTPPEWEKQKASVDLSTPDCLGGDGGSKA